MTIKTRKLPATSREGERMRATDADTGAVLTIPYPHDVADPYAHVAQLLANAMGLGEVTSTDAQSAKTTFTT
ncbi:hypothetical protein [Streptomyces sp. NPDC057854]|uniref:hypothetical protein n=1 Tax=unclassified Streptomyces TaxID=2593676 RepID=UPI0036800B2B